MRMLDDLSYNEWIRLLKSRQQVATIPMGFYELPSVKWNFPTSLCVYLYSEVRDRICFGNTFYIGLDRDS